MPGAIAMLSSSVNVSGRSATLARSTASGMRPPLAARANTKTASSGEALRGERRVERDGAADAGCGRSRSGRRRRAGRAPARPAASVAGADAAHRAACAAAERARAPRRCSPARCGASSLPGGSWSTICCQSRDRGRVVAAVVGDGAGERERLRQLRVGLQRALDQGDRFRVVGGAAGWRRRRRRSRPAALALFGCSSSARWYAGSASAKRPSTVYERASMSPALRRRPGVLFMRSASLSTIAAICCRPLGAARPGGWCLGGRRDIGVGIGRRPDPAAASRSASSRSAASASTATGEAGDQPARRPRGPARRRCRRAGVRRSRARRRDARSS